MKIFSISWIALVALLVNACAPTYHRGTVAMIVNESEVHVGLGKGEVKVGDDLIIYQGTCTRLRRHFCSMFVLGEAKVTEVLDDHYSVAKLVTSLGIHEGDVVEKK